MPALVETALNMGNAGVTAVTQLHRLVASANLPPARMTCDLPRAAKPAMAETAAHMHHVVVEHLAPGVSAASKTLGDSAVESTDRVAEVMLGTERHQRVHETLDAFGTIAKFVSGTNETLEVRKEGKGEVKLLQAEDRGLDYGFSDYGALHPPLYPSTATAPDYYDYAPEVRKHPSLS